MDNPNHWQKINMTAILNNIIFQVCKKSLGIKKGENNPWYEELEIVFISINVLHVLTLEIPAANFKEFYAYAKNLLPVLLNS